MVVKPRHQRGKEKGWMKRTWFLFTIIEILILLLGVNTRALSAGEPAKTEYTLKLMGINRTLDPWKLYEE